MKDSGLVTKPAELDHCGRTDLSRDPRHLSPLHLLQSNPSTRNSVEEAHLHSASDQTHSGINISEEEEIANILPSKSKSRRRKSAATAAAPGAAASASAALPSRHRGRLLPISEPADASTAAATRPQAERDGPGLGVGAIRGGRGRGGGRGGGIRGGGQGGRGRASLVNRLRSRDGKEYIARFALDMLNQSDQTFQSDELYTLSYTKKLNRRR